MKAVVCQNTVLSVVDLPEPTPGPGQVLVSVERCGICGSDLHIRHHCDPMKALLDKVGFGRMMPASTDPLVFGHELCCEVLDFGPGCDRKIPKGTRVVGQPVLRVGGDIHLSGLSPIATGGYAERMLMQESALVPVPNGLSPDMAALTEPMAVAWHAVRRSEIARKDVAIVIGCGPVGLAVICLLKAQGVGTVVASDFSQGRRALARRCGADVVINPSEGSPYAPRPGEDFMRDLPALLELSVGTREKLGKLPIPWHVTWRLAEKLGAAAPKRPVIFECVGVPGIVQQIIDGAPLMSRIIVAGVCMQIDRYEPALAIHKEIDLRFVFGHSPLEYRDTLQMIAEGKVSCAPMITGVVGLGGVSGAFEALKDPETHAKILIDPRIALNNSAITPAAFGRA
ncbi:alcohol dehydrogenase [Sinimarinibacterium sp. CAU 1509]|uniref:zinc-binding dehydrogenase n=1 Tax=Sinimarinibacterium sp. CAU 1509 TaxID=2562283 RepID=UPI0010AD6F0F|nr:zinc-binding dehydrogenase [Sinimarinibacterium sp. CAU 1509]TJY61000.1 alcohol dehydrogenase [Sinimarinibacterium sp. CAU 1509]